MVDAQMGVSLSSGIMRCEVKTDFGLFLEENNLTEELLQKAKANTVYAQMDAFEADRIILSESAIEGFGVFARRDIMIGDAFAAFNGGIWSCVGRFMNHSSTPNTEMIRVGGITVYSTLRQIPMGEELTVNYRQVREVLGL
jgi:SET domain-containing protein